MATRKVLLITLLVASIAVHFAFFGQPDQVVFDEVHFGKFASAYYTHQYYFDIHPPLGKLLIAGFGKLFDFRPESPFPNIGQPFPDNSYLALRFLPVLAGTLLPIIIFLLAIQPGIRPLLAFFAGMLAVLDNALLAQSRYILLDMFLLSFGFAGLLFYFKYKNSGTVRNLLWTGIFFGLSASIKWTGLAFLGLAGIVELVSLFSDGKWRVVSNYLRPALYMIAVPFIVYFSVYTVHFSLLPRSGEGDAFMTPEFRATLIDSEDWQDPVIQPLNNFEKFIELNKRMYMANATLTATHPYSSKWYTWPLMLRSVYYWNGPAEEDRPTSIENPPSQKRIYLIGNPVVWWGSTVAVLYLILLNINYGLSRRSKKSIVHSPDSIIYILLGGWLLNMLPFIGIGRVMFLYHYLAGLLFAILMFAYALNRMEKPRNTVIALLTAAFLLFIYFAPLSYGLPLDVNDFSARMWLSSWR